MCHDSTFLDAQMIQKNKWLYVQKVTEGFILFPFFRYFGPKASSYSFGEGGKKNKKKIISFTVPWKFLGGDKITNTQSLKNPHRYVVHQLPQQQRSYEFALPLPLIEGYMHSWFGSFGFQNLPQIFILQKSIQTRE